MSSKQGSGSRGAGHRPQLMMALTYMGTARVLLRSVISTSNRFLISERRHFDGAPTTSDLLLTTDVNEMRERVRLVPTVNRSYCMRIG
jgi:hypothetical protein